MKNATPTPGTRDPNGNLYPDLTTPWQPPAQPSGLALAVVPSHVVSPEERRDARERRRGW